MMIKVVDIQGKKGWPETNMFNKKKKRQEQRKETDSASFKKGWPGNESSLLALLTGERRLERDLRMHMTALRNIKARRKSGIAAMPLRTSTHLSPSQRYFRPDAWNWMVIEVAGCLEAV